MRPGMMPPAQRNALLRIGWVRSLTSMTGFVDIQRSPTRAHIVEDDVGDASSHYAPTVSRQHGLYASSSRS